MKLSISDHIFSISIPENILSGKLHNITLQYCSEIKYIISHKINISMQIGFVRDLCSIGVWFTMGDYKAVATVRSMFPTMHIFSFMKLNIEL